MNEPAIRISVSKSQLEALRAEADRLGLDPEALDRQLENINDPERPAMIEGARREYGSDDVEIDDDAAISPSDGGVWVQGWVWLSYPEYTSHDLLCNLCGEQLNNQCLNPTCAESDPHTNGEAYCAECFAILGGFRIPRFDELFGE